MTEQEYRAKVRTWAEENGLSGQELDVIEMVAAAKYTYKMIGEELGMTEHTVKKTVKRIGEKLGWRAGIGRLDIACTMLVKFSNKAAVDPVMAGFAERLENDLKGESA